MQVYIVQALYTNDKKTETKSILVVYGNEVSANRTVKMLRENFEPIPEAIKAEYSVLGFEVL